MHKDMKQKTLLVLTILAFGYLGYQVYGMVKSDIGGPVMLTPTVANAAEPNHTTQASMNNEDAPKPATLDAAPLASGQKAYLDMVNQYELAKMKRRLLEEKAAIAAAENRIATLKHQTREIDNSLNGSSEVMNDADVNAHHHAGYQLSYVDQQKGKWSATLNRNGRYYPVRPGMELADGSKVLSINRSGVTLVNGDDREKVTFEGVVTLPPEKKPETKAMSNQSPMQDRPPADIQAQAQHALEAAGILEKKETTMSTTKNITKQQGKILNVAAAAKPEKQERDIVVAMNTSTKKKRTEKLETPVVENKQPVKKATVVPPQKILAKKTSTKPVVKSPTPTKQVFYSKDEKRILALPKQTYTIQLIGSYHKDIVDNFAVANDLGNRGMSFYVNNRGKPWYILLYGNYPSLKAAQTALSKLPPNLTPEDPWVRPVAEVQQDLQNRKHA